MCQGHTPHSSRVACIDHHFNPSPAHTMSISSSSLNSQFLGLPRYGQTHNTSIDLMRRMREYKRWWSVLWRIMNDWMLVQRYDLRCGASWMIECLPNDMICDVAHHEWLNACPTIWSQCWFCTEHESTHIDDLRCCAIDLMLTSSSLQLASPWISSIQPHA
jgi:hypothetical protein